MKRVFRTSLTVRLWAVMVLSLFAASCSNDAFFGFEDLEHDTELGFIATFPRKDNTKNMIYAPALKTFKDTLEIRRAVSILSQSLILNNENQLVVSNKVSAESLKIDEEVFCYLMRLLNLYNDTPPKTIIQKTQKVQRHKELNAEGSSGTRGNSIMADAIASLVWDVALELHLDFTAELFYEWYFNNRSTPYFISSNRWMGIAEYANSKAGNNGYFETNINNNTYKYKSLSFYEAGPNIGFALGTATIYVNSSNQVIGLRDKYDFGAGDRNFVNEGLTQFLGFLGTGYFPIYYGTHISY